MDAAFVDHVFFKENCQNMAGVIPLSPRPPQRQVFPQHRPAAWVPSATGCLFEGWTRPWQMGAAKRNPKKPGDGVSTSLWRDQKPPPAPAEEVTWEGCGQRRTEDCWFPSSFINHVSMHRVRNSHSI